MKTSSLLKYFSTMATLALASVCGNAETTAGTSAAPVIALSYCGSDFLAGTLEREFEAQVESAHPDYALTAELRGSRWALVNLREKKCDFAVVLLPDKNAVPEIVSGEWKAIPVAYQTAIVVVSKSNAIDQINFYQLSGIFSRFAQERIDHWAQISSNFDGSARIRAIVNNMRGSSLSAFFQSKISPNSSLLSETLTLCGNDEILKDMSYETIAIVSSFDPIKYPTLKALPVSTVSEKGAAGTAYAPSFSNIAHGDYPFSAPFYFVYPAAKRDQILPILEVAVSDKFANFVESQSLAIPPKAQRLGVRRQIQKYFEEKSKK